MDPFFAKNRLSAYIDGQLSEEEARAVERAIRDDDDVRTEYDAMRAAVTLLRRHGPARAPADFQARVLSAIDAQPRPGVLVLLRDRLRQVPIEAVALAAAALIVVVVLASPDSEGPAAPAPPVEVKNGAAAPDITAAPDLSLPTASTAAPTPDPAPPAEATPQKDETHAADPKEAPTASTGPSLQKKAVPPPDDVFVAEWEKQAQDPAPASADLDPEVTPSELYEGVQTGQTTVQYRIAMNDAEVLFSLQQLAQSTGGRLLDASGESLKARTLTTTDNYARVQLVAPPGRADEIHQQLKRLGARADVTGSPLFGSQYITFVIEVSYLP